jgi:hypothetical protein
MPRGFLAVCFSGPKFCKLRWVAGADYTPDGAADSLSELPFRCADDGVFEVDARSGEVSSSLQF